LVTPDPAGRPATAPATTAASASATADPPVLDVRGLTAGYGGRAVVYDLDLTVRRGEIVVVLGSNGAGKTTTLKSIVGLVRPLGGTVRYCGEPWRTDRPWMAPQSGLSFIPAERFTFAQLTVEENLMLGCYRLASDAARRARLDGVFAMFPVLESRLAQKAGTMSGGEQRMLSIGVAMMVAPRLLLLDEPSLGLAPVVVEQIFSAVQALSRSQGMSVLMVEQNVGQALPVADRCYVMRSGRMILEEDAAVTRERAQLWDLF
jgi:branched-chain amino acid transport system ATP-binding protein